MAASLALALVPAVAEAKGISFKPGAPGIGDPYFPLDGNGGYDVSHYGLTLSYDPDTDVLRGVAKLEITAKQDLSSFNLDLIGMNVRLALVDGWPARVSRSGGEMTVKPLKGIRRGERFNAYFLYDGVPQTIDEGVLGLSGFIHTDDGTYVAGQPDSAAYWYPVNDHPLDKASYSFSITVPRGLEAIANGELRDVSTFGPWTTWKWEAKEPMASYLTTATIGEFKVDAYKANGIKYWDAMDPDLLAEPEPRTGRQMAISQIAEPSWKRLTRTIDVPAGGGELSFWVRRETEPSWDFFFVEARPAGTEDWTTLRDLNGHNSQVTAGACNGLGSIYAQVASYIDVVNGQCVPTGTTGEWWAASGSSDGYEQWRVDLGAYAGQQVELSLTHASDDLYQIAGVELDDIVGPGGQGTTSFEADGNVFDGWTVSGPPADAPPNENDWIVGGAAQTPPTEGEVARSALDQQPQIITFLEGLFGRYPFSSAGSIVDDVEGIGFALENQTRPTYSRAFFNVRSEPAESVVVHELAHQWVGDSLAISLWRHLWLNEGFATYTEWLWSEEQGRSTAQDFFDFYASQPADDPFWSIKIGDPGPIDLFDGAVYDRGAMTLHALRTRIGDGPFFRLLREWIARNRGGNVAIPQFIALAERISGQELDPFFDEWLFTPAKPASLGDAAAMRKAGSTLRVVPGGHGPMKRVTR
ncbi:M1 family metallopeptidase [Solirubrobacter sp. CPCC 204708]|uniref:M1 family metallopeptidase n=2 Tax=Solirubrobacter deserti TaxID=2282478 RepID=A0ABT4RCA5_9ACTN|nr:M1 family metallopeptidase [Solirubrobacter deserti]